MKTINETIARMISDEAMSVKKIDKTSKKLSKKTTRVPRLTTCDRLQGNFEILR